MPAFHKKSSMLLFKRHSAFRATTYTQSCSQAELLISLIRICIKKGSATVKKSSHSETQNQVYTTALMSELIWYWCIRYEWENSQEDEESPINQHWNTWHYLAHQLPSTIYLSTKMPATCLWHSQITQMHKAYRQHKFVSLFVIA